MREKEHANRDQLVHNESRTVGYSHVPSGRTIHAHFVFPRGLATRQVPVSLSALLARRERLREHAHVARDRHRSLLRHRSSLQASHETRRVLSPHRCRLDRFDIDLAAARHLHGAYLAQKRWPRYPQVQRELANTNVKAILQLGFTRASVSDTIHCDHVQLH